jgi:hypothetical protein
MYMKNRESIATPNLAVLRPIGIAPASGVSNEQDIEEKIRATLQPSNAYQCCTADKMPREHGRDVGPYNRVYGTFILSVVNSSTWPLVPGSGRQASV